MAIALDIRSPARAVRMSPGDDDSCLCVSHFDVPDGGGSMDCLSS